MRMSGVARLTGANIATTQPPVKPPAMRQIATATTQPPGAISRFMPSKHAGQQFTMRFDAEQRALLERLGKDHGGKKEAVLAGLRALEQGAPEPTPRQALDVLEKLVRAKPKRTR